MAHLVRHAGPYPLVAAVFEPDLEQTFLRPQGEAEPDDFRLFELLTDQRKEKTLPHLVDVVLFLNFGDPHTAEGRLLPHWNFLVTEEEQVDLARHGRGALHVHVEIEKVLDC